MAGLTKSSWITLAVLAILLVAPPLLFWYANAFYLDLAIRLVILGIAATSLNLILGYGGLVSFGHAVFLGIGAYAVGIPTYHYFYGGMDGISSTNGFFQFGMAIGISALFALITGTIILRTKGVYFIMITMAFAQMVYYLFVSMEEYGGDDGLVIEVRSEFPMFSLDDPITLYLVCWGSLALIMFLVRMIIHSRFGMVLQGAKDNEERMITLGYNTYLYRLTAYVIAGAMCGYAGALYANFSSFISPENINWHISGELIFMVVLGGTGTTVGPLLGAAAFILLEEFLGRLTIYWHLPFGLMLIGIVLFVRGGLMGLFHGKEK